MHLPYATLLLVLTPACVAAPADPADPIDPPATPAACAPADQPGHTIVACGFGPALALAAIDDASVYAVSSQHTLYGVDLHTAAVTRLYHSLDAYTALPTLARGIVAHDHALFFPGMVELGGGFTYGILAIAADHPTTTARVVMIADAYEPIAPVIDDGSRLYWASVQHENFSAFSGPVVAMGYDGSAITPRTTEYGTPVAVQGGQLYYRHDDGLARVPAAGGAAQVIATGLADTASTDRAIDDAYAYAATAAAPYAIRRFPIAGGASELVFEAGRGDVEVSLDPPHDLRRDGDSLYFLQRVAGEVDVLYRVRLDGAPVAEPLAQAAELGAPVFDATAIYVAYQRGGGDAPIEGVIARIAK